MESSSGRRVPRSERARQASVRALEALVYAQRLVGILERMVVVLGAADLSRDHALLALASALLRCGRELDSQIRDTQEAVDVLLDASANGT